MAVTAGPGLVVAVVVLAVLGPLVSWVVAAAVAVVVGAALWSSLWFGSTAALVRALGAELADEDRDPRPFTLTEGLCAGMGLTQPDIRIVEDPWPSALALGLRRGDANLVVTRGLLELLDPVQLEGVLAHELVHLKRADTGPVTAAAALLLPVAALVPAGADLLHRLAGAGREFATDALAVGITRYPPGLSQALGAMVDAGAGIGPAGSPLVAGRVGRLTRWLWTAVLGDPPTGEALVGELDAPATRIAALDEW